MGFAAVDHETLRRCQRGDTEAFERLCDAVGRDVYRLALSILRNTDDADDVYQEVLIRVHRHLPNLRDISRFPGWLKRIAVNQCYTHSGRAARKGHASWDALEDEPQVEETVWRPQGQETPHQSALRSELGREINEAISQLPPRQRTCVTLFEVEGLSIREIADELSCSEGAVKFNLHQARKRLQKSLERYLVHDRSLAAEAS